MKQALKPLIAGALAVLLSMTLAGPAMAASPDETDVGYALVATHTAPAADIVKSAELEAYLASLAPQERADFVRTMLPATTVVTTTMSPLDATARKSVTDARANGTLLTPMTAGCWTWRYDARQESLAGTVLYKYYHVIRWCVSGTTVTSASVADRGDSPSPSVGDTKASVRPLREL